MPQGGGGERQARVVSPLRAARGPRRSALLSAGLSRPVQPGPGDGPTRGRARFTGRAPAAGSSPAGEARLHPSAHTLSPHERATLGHHPFIKYA